MGKKKSGARRPREVDEENSSEAEARTELVGTRIADLIEFAEVTLRLPSLDVTQQLIIIQELTEIIQDDTIFGRAVIRLFDISVYLEGNVIDLGTYKLQVVEVI